MAFRFGKSLQINLTRSSLASHARSLLNHRPISVARQTAAFHDVAYWLPVPSASSSSSSTPHSSFSSSAKASRDDTTTTVAVVSELDNPALAQLPQLEGVDFLVGDTPEAFLKHDSKMATCEAYIFVAPMKSTETLSAAWKMSSSPKWLHSFFTGIDALSGFCASDLFEGASLTNARGAYSDSLAEWALTSCLYFNKQIPRCQENRLNKKWDKFTMGHLYGKTIGFVGFGHIATTTATLARAFGMKILALKRNVPKQQQQQHQIADAIYSSESACEMLRECDFVVCSLPGTPKTDGFMSSKEFEAMPSHSVFISIGRGSAVDEEALDHALRSGSIAGAALDVFRTEPLPRSNPLWEHENLLLTAHNADFTGDNVERGWNVWLENYSAFMNNRPFATLIANPSAGY